MGWPVDPAESLAHAALNSSFASQPQPGRDGLDGSQALSMRTNDCEEWEGTSLPQCCSSTWAYEDAARTVVSGQHRACLVRGAASW